MTWLSERRHVHGLTGYVEMLQSATGALPALSGPAALIEVFDPLYQIGGPRSVRRSLSFRPARSNVNAAAIEKERSSKRAQV